MVAGSLSGKVAIVTGAGNPHGIGVTTARTLAREGARIVLVDLESTPVHDSAATLKDEGFEVAARAVDISDESQAKARSEERRVGKEWDSTGRTRGGAAH